MSPYNVGLKGRGTMAGSCVWLSLLRRAWQINVRVSIEELIGPGVDGIESYKENVVSDEMRVEVGFKV